MGVINKLVDKGNTILIIEHNMDVIKLADYIIDIGYEGGKGGGELIAKASSIPRDKLPLYLAWHKQSQGQALSWFSQQLTAVNWPQVFKPSTW